MTAYACCEINNQFRVVRVSDDRQHVTPLELSDPLLAEKGVSILLEQTDPAEGNSLPIAKVRLLAPIPRPRRNIFCVGKNYHEHAKEFSASGFDSSAASGVVPKHPIIFSKVPESVVGPDSPVYLDDTVSTAIDYEVELAVIIGKAGRNLSTEEAMQHVWGYTIINDITARDLQGLHSQWLIGKSQDSFCPMGPWMVTADELDLTDTSISCHINGELRQQSNTADLIFDVPQIIAALSNGITLLPGDVIATGTPAGVGLGFKPPRYLVPGDVMTLSVKTLGTLENSIEAYPR